MKKVIVYLMITVFTILLLISCSDNQNTENDASDNHDDTRKIAWDFVKDKDWDGTAKANWKSAEVTKVIVDDKYQLLDESYRGKEVTAVSFEDKEEVVVGTPLILIDTNTNEVIGYMPSE